MGGAVLLVSASTVIVSQSLWANSESEVGGSLAGATLSREAWDGILEDASESVFRVETFDCSKNPISTGTGFLVEEGVVTNQHVVEDAALIELTNDQGKQIEVRSWQVSRKIDLALLQISAHSLPELELLTKNPTPGALVANIGHPLGEELSIRDGRIFEVVDGEEYDTEGELLAMTSEALSGDSGGPVISTDGKVVGVTTYLLYKRNLSMAIPVEALNGFLDARLDLGVTRPCEVG